MSALAHGSPAALSVREAANEAPDAVAIVTTSKVLTYRAVWARTSATMASLAPRLNSGAKVAIVATLRVDTLFALYALFELGVPAVLVHPRLTSAEREALLALASPTLVLDEGWQAPDDGQWHSELHVDDENPLAILFTSGSTGTSKGVELSRRAFVASADASAANLGWASDDRWLLCMPLAHVGGLSVVTRCLAARAAVALAPWTGDIDGLVGAIDRLEVTLASFVPAMLARLLEGREPRLPSRVRAVLLGGDATSASLRERALSLGIPVRTTYGMTEACSQIATQHDDADPGVGRPLSGVEVRTVDGEIQVRGPALFTRYLSSGGAPSPFLEGGWFPTGDLGSIDESGYLHITGRRSDRLVTGGENVDPREVERALVAHARVREACVFGIPDERWGQIVCVALVLEASEAAGDASDALTELGAHVATVLAPHKRPRRVVVCEALASNDTGKTDRRRIAASLAGSLVPSGWS